MRKEREEREKKEGRGLGKKRLEMEVMGKGR